jgi:hypothetical protein
VSAQVEKGILSKLQAPYEALPTGYFERQLSRVRPEDECSPVLDIAIGVDAEYFADGTHRDERIAIAEIEHRHNFAYKGKHDC